MRVLFLSNLFPSHDEPVRGLDNATLLHALVNFTELEVRVISPRPSLSARGEAAWLPRIQDERLEPQFIPCPYVPKVGSLLNDRLMEHALRIPLKQAVEDFRPDGLLVSWLFPDGCAAASLARALNLPVVLVTQGSDTHAYLGSRTRCRKILRAIDRSRGVICRSGDLADRLVQAGVSRSLLSIVYNGVDREVFRYRGKSETRASFGISVNEAVILFVGNLLPVKDPIFLIRAHAEWNRRRKAEGKPSGRLILIGDGPLRSRVGRESRRLGSDHQVNLLGRLPAEIVSRWMNAADVLCLSSRNEGFPNVILEALASELPVITTDVGGIREKLAEGGGVLVHQGDLNSYVKALTRAVEATQKDEFNQRKPGVISAPPDWSSTAARYREILELAF